MGSGLRPACPGMTAWFHAKSAGSLESRRLQPVAAAGIGEACDIARPSLGVDGAGEIAPGADEAVELGEVARRQLAERAGDEVALRCDAGLGQAAPLRGQMHGVGAPVAGDGAALDQPGLHQPVDEAGDVALGHVEPFGEFALADALLRSVRVESRSNCGIERPSVRMRTVICRACVGAAA